MEELDRERPGVESFLIAEHSELNQDLRRLRDEGVRRMNFFISLTTGVLGGLLLLFGVSSLSPVFLELVSIVSFAFLSLLGWETFRYLISREESSDFHMRAMARIRRYFVEVDPSVFRFLLRDTSDGPSPYIKRESMPSIINAMASIISLLIAFDVGIVINKFSGRLELILGAGLLGFGISFAALRSHVKESFKSTYEKAQDEMEFPALDEDQSFPPKGQRQPPNKSLNPTA